MADAILPSKLHLRDVMRTALVGLRTRKLRATLSALGIMIGIASLVAVLGLSDSSRSDLLSQLDRLGTNLLVVQAGQGIGLGSGELPDTAKVMVDRIGPVEDVSAVASVDANVYRSDLVPSTRSGGISVKAVDDDLLGTLEGEVASGRFLDEVADDYPTVVLGSVAAERLGISDMDHDVLVWLGDQWFAVVGILEPLELASDLDRVAMVGHQAAEDYLGFEGAASSVYVRTNPDFVDDVMAVIPATANPENPGTGEARPDQYEGPAQGPPPRAPPPSEETLCKAAPDRIWLAGPLVMLPAMLVLRMLVFAVGLVLTGYTLMSAVRTVILPRGAQSYLARMIFRPLRLILRKIASPERSFDFRDRVMAYFAPLGMLVLVAAWLALVTVGFMLMFWSIEQRGWGDAFHESGSSLLTLGFKPVEGALLQFLSFIEAGLGLGLLALLITYLPTLYGSFQQRERLVALLEVRAGSPPSAIEMLTRFHRIGWSDQLTDMWSEWEEWFADIEESHTSFPMLAFFRSPQPERHWVTAAGTVMDAAALVLSTVDLRRQPQAALVIRSGFLSLRRIAGFFGVQFDPDPAPTDPISITRAEFDEACEVMETVGLPLKPDREQAWRDFAGWRVNYDTVLLALAEITMAPYAPWSSDRSTLDHSQPRVRRWGKREELDPMLEPEAVERPWESPP